MFVGSPFAPSQHLPSTTTSGFSTWMLPWCFLTTHFKKQFIRSNLRACLPRTWTIGLQTPLFALWPSIEPLSLVQLYWNWPLLLGSLKNQYWFKHVFLQTSRAPHHFNPLHWQPIYYRLRVTWHCCPQRVLPTHLQDDRLRPSSKNFRYLVSSNWTWCLVTPRRVHTLLFVEYGMLNTPPTYVPISELLWLSRDSRTTLVNITYY